MEEQRSPVLKVEEIFNGYLVTLPNGNMQSFQWSVTNDQRQELVQMLINVLGMKHDLKVERRKS